MAILDAFMVINNEEELIGYALESFVSLGDALGTLSLVDNNSTDATLGIVERFRDRLNIVLQHERHHSHHGQMRTRAMDPLTAPWIFYLDGDESCTADFADWLRSGDINRSNYWRFYKYTTIIDCFHYVEGGNGPTERLFRNLPGIHFPQTIHTVPTHPDLGNCLDVPNVLLFDHTAIKSREALWAKGSRYGWAFREKTPAVGPSNEYIYRVDNAFQNFPERNVEFPDHIKNRIFCGPGYRR